LAKRRILALVVGERLKPPAKANPAKMDNGSRLFPLDHAWFSEVRIGIGAALRKAYAAELIDRGPGEEERRSRPRLHIRRAHWHTYHVSAGRTGSRLNWLPPIPVNAQDLSDLPAVVRPVKESDSVKK